MYFRVVVKHNKISMLAPPVPEIEVDGAVCGCKLAICAAGDVTSPAAWPVLPGGRAAASARAPGGTRVLALRRRNVCGAAMWLEWSAAHRPDRVWAVA